MILDERPLGLADRLFDRMELLGNLETWPAHLDHLDDAHEVPIRAPEPLQNAAVGLMMAELLSHAHALSPRRVSGKCAARGKTALLRMWWIKIACRSGRSGGGLRAAFV